MSAEDSNVMCVCGGQGRGSLENSKSNLERLSHFALHVTAQRFCLFDHFEVTWGSITLDIIMLIRTCLSTRRRR